MFKHWFSQTTENRGIEIWAPSFGDSLLSLLSHCRETGEDPETYEIVKISNDSGIVVWSRDFEGLTRLPE